MVLDDSIPMRPGGESEVNFRPNLNIDSTSQDKKAHQPLKAKFERCKEPIKEFQQFSTRTEKTPEHFVIEIPRTTRKRALTPLGDKSQTSHKPTLGTSQEKAMLYSVSDPERIVDIQFLERPDQLPRKELVELHKHNETTARDKTAIEHSSQKKRPPRARLKRTKKTKARVPRMTTRIKAALS